MIAVEVANADRVGLETLASVFEPPPPVDLEKWAVRHIVFDPPATFAGPYNPDLFPFWTDVLAALSPEDPCRTVTLAKSAQLGGTILAQVFVLGSMDLDPGPTGVVHPSDIGGAKWSRQKLAPMIRSNDRIKSLFPVDGKEGGNSILYKERTDGRGFIMVAGANSPSGLSMQTWARIVMDDLSKWELNTAGDPEEQSASRAQGIEFAKIFKISTPLLDGDCRITRSYEAGSGESYHVPCPHCGHLQTLEWDNMLATTPEDADPDAAAFSCTACGGIIEERHRAWMVDPVNGAKWIAARPDRMVLHRSFRIWSAYAPLMSWSRIWADWLDRRGSPAREQVFVNDVAGKAYKGDSEAPPVEKLMDRAKGGHKRGTIPAGHPLVFVGIDVQEDRVEWQAVAYGAGWRRAVVDVGVIPAAITEDRGRSQLDSLLKATWPNAAGQRIKADRIAIDGNYDTPSVFSWMKNHPRSRVLMVRGVPGRKPAILQKVGQGSDRTGKKLKYGGRFFNVAVDLLKLTLYRALKKEDADAEWFVSLPAGLDDDYFEQLTAERRQQVKDKWGFSEIRWVLPSGKRNEMLDTMIYSEAAARNYGVAAFTDADWERLRDEREERAPDDDAQLDLEDVVAIPAPAPAAEDQRESKTEADAAPAPTKPRRPKRHRNGWVGRC